MRSKVVESVAVESEGRAALAKALAAWSAGRPSALVRWFERELDSEGVPRRLPVGDWARCLAALAEARQGSAPAWPDDFDARIEGFFLQALRFSRPDGSPVFGPAAPAGETATTFRYWARHLSDPALQTVVDRWFPDRRRPQGAPPLPAASGRDRPLAILRPDWSKVGDFAAIDHRTAGASTRFELVGLGRGWLGPTWGGGPDGDTSGTARPTTWITGASADLAEWTFRAGGSRLVRTALLLRGRRLALLADQVDGLAETDRMAIEVRPGIDVVPSAEVGSLKLVHGKSRASAQVIPLSLPEGPTLGERGRLRLEGGRLVLEQPRQGRRSWVPLLVSWEPRRARKVLTWRRLTVTEASRVCAPETAVAFRVSWGRDETLVIYRSLARPAQRAFLGHSTRARFLVGTFNRDGDVETIFEAEE